MSLFSISQTVGVPPGEGLASPWRNFTALRALFGVSIGRMCRGWRLPGLVVLFLLPSVIVALNRVKGVVEQPGRYELYLLFVLIPSAFVPFIALLYSSGLIQEEVEDQTLTYLLTRPVPRPMIYLTKLAAAVLFTAVLAAVCTAINEAVIYAGAEAPGGGLGRRIAVLAGLMSLSLIVYNAMFGFVGLLLRKALPVGVLYIIIFEGVLAGFDFVFRRFTVVYYFRVLALHGFAGDEGLAESFREMWSLDASASPAPAECVAILLGAAAVLAVAGAWIVQGREFRVKTPESA